MLAKNFLFALALTVAAAPFLGCAVVSGDEEGDGEQEGVGQSNDELRSAVSCKEHTATAYRGGSAYSIQVVEIGGKAVAKPTGHAFLRMQAAASAAGVKLSLTSGFRTMAEQTHLYNCYKTGSCNSGNIAAAPGHSNHQNGLALDLSTSTWLSNNASKFGFVRTVAREPWHYEFHGKDPGGPCSRGTTKAGDDPTDSSGDTSANDTPTTPAEDKLPAAGSLTWVAPKQDSEAQNGFVVKAHTTSSAIVKVVYSQGTFVFGTSTAAATDFGLSYTFMYMGAKTLTVKGYDANGALQAVDHVDFTLLP